MKFVINLLLLLIALPVKAELIMRFQPHITSHATHLGDLLLITSDKNNWSEIILDSKPVNGQLIHKDQIITWMQRKTGSFKVRWKGKSTAMVEQITRTTAKELLNKAQTALSEQLKLQYPRILLSCKTVLKDSDIPLADFKIKIPKDYPVAKRVCVHLNYKKRSIPIWFSVKAYKKVLVAKHRIQTHTRIQPNELVLKTIDIAGLHTSPLTQLPKVLWLNKSINKNHILTQEDFGQPPQVLKGQEIKVSVQLNKVSIIIDAIAQNEGYSGQAIQMKNPSTNKYFMATITGKNQAEIKR